MSLLLRGKRHTARPEFTLYRQKAQRLTHVYLQVYVPRMIMGLNLFRKVTWADLVKPTIQSLSSKLALETLILYAHCGTGSFYDINTFWWSLSKTSGLKSSSLAGGRAGPCLLVHYLFYLDPVCSAVSQPPVPGSKPPLKSLWEKEETPLFT